MFSRKFGFAIFTAILLAGTFTAFPQTTEQLNNLGERIESGSDEIKRDALNQLRRFESESASRIAARSLSDQSEIVRATAIAAVVYMPRSEAAALIEPFLRDRSDFLRREAVYALGAIAYPASAGSVIAVLKNDKDTEVRAGAAIALGQIGNTDALEVLAKILESKPKSSRAFLRRSAARSIGQIAQSSRENTVSNSTPENFLPDKFKSGYGEPAANNALLNRFDVAASILGRVLLNNKESTDTRREAAFALGAIGDESKAAILKRYVNDPDYYLAEICREALIKLGGR